MPRHFSEAERSEIERLIMNTAAELFMRYGVNKTTIEDITEKARVGKGTFYLFFRSKGDLFMKIYTNVWTEVHDALDKKYLGKKGKLSLLIIDYIYENRRVLFNHPILSVVYDRHTLTLISEPAVTKSFQAFRELSSSRLIAIIESWLSCNQISCQVSPEIISGMMRSLSYLNYHKDEIGEDIFDQVIQKFADGITYVVNQE